MSRFTLARLCQIAAVTLFSSAAAFSSATAQEKGYPNKTIQITIPYTVGGGIDTTARHIASYMTEKLGQSVIVDSRPGGATLIGASHVARSQPDGYTILLTGGSTMSLQPLTFEGTMPFDPVKDFAPIGMISRIPLFLAVPSDTPYKTLQDLIDDAKRRPGEISYASNGTGSLAHLGTEIFANNAGIKFNHVPYKSFIAAAPDLASGRVTFMLSDLAGLNALLQAGSVRLLAVSSGERSAFNPEVPTFKESGFPDYEVEIWVGLFAPAGTPQPIVAKLGEVLKGYLHTEEGKKALAQMGHEADPSDGEVVRQRIISEQKLFTPVVESVGLGRGK